MQTGGVTRPASLLASDAERDATADMLRDHVAEGRITMEEFRERLDLVFAARTLRELDRAMAGLPDRRVDYLGRWWASPEERRARLERRYRRGWGRFVRVNAVVWSIWLAMDLILAHGVVLFPVVLTLPWGVLRIVCAPRFRSAGRL